MPSCRALESQPRGRLGVTVSLAAASCLVERSRENVHTHTYTEIVSCKQNNGSNFHLMREKSKCQRRRASGFPNVAYAYTKKLLCMCQRGRDREVEDWRQRGRFGG